MDSQYNRQEFWTDFARRFEERMARSAARWQARQERRAARYNRHAGWGGPSGFGAPHGEPDRGLQDQVEAMAKTIRALTERVNVLERIASDPEVALRAEIEKLRRQDDGGGRGS